MPSRTASAMQQRPLACAVTAVHGSCHTGTLECTRGPPLSPTRAAGGLQPTLRGPVASRATASRASQQHAGPRPARPFCTQIMNDYRSSQCTSIALHLHPIPANRPTGTHNDCSTVWVLRMPSASRLLAGVLKNQATSSHPSIPSVDMQPSSSGNAFLTSRAARLRAMDPRPLPQHGQASAKLRTCSYAKASPHHAECRSEPLRYNADPFIRSIMMTP